VIAVALFIAGSFAVVYILLGYPLLLALLRPRERPPVRKDPGFRTTVSIVVAVYNGEKFIAAKLASLLALDYPPELIDIIVVSDGSTDRTDAIVTQVSDARVSLIRVPHQGKAAALNEALRVATGEILFLTDVRQPIDRQALGHLVANFADPTVGAVTGELHLFRPGAGEQADMDLYWRYEVWARGRQSRIDSIFTATGCIYAMRRSLLEPIPLETLTDDAVLPLRAFFRGYRVVFDPDAIAFDYPAVPGTEFRRRVRTLAGLWQIARWMPEMFTRANRMRFHFLSHKYARLVLPWAMLLVYASTLALPASRFRDFLLIDEAALLVLAAIDPLIPAGLFIKRISSPARTFLIMNAAAIASLSIFFVPASRFWRPTVVRVKDTLGKDATV
jgi:cellulose synthase/poly-beta-1,6-N-acetylglucosamine synthase-like glycosyltransferase